MEEFLLHLLFLFDKLNIVDQKQIYRAVFIAKLIVLFVGDYLNKFVDELFGLNVQDLFFRKFPDDVVADRLHEMCLTQAGTPVEKEWIIIFTLHRGHSHAGCMGKVVGAAYDKVAEGIVGI